MVLPMWSLGSRFTSFCSFSVIALLVAVVPSATAALHEVEVTLTGYEHTILSDSTDEAANTHTIEGLMRSTQRAQIVGTHVVLADGSPGIDYEVIVAADACTEVRPCGLWIDNVPILFWACTLHIHAYSGELKEETAPSGWSMEFRSAANELGKAGLYVVEGVNHTCW